ncbi:Flp family type IVb pilin [uncultured Hoeflea sp.]|uniref:Flp family type IVb pilin n=1 Tax=uncultured Hoeflea sp. TaxID=538666 RepID=UPI002605D4EE|nr:Flp family type IVb pilin [uncultured Hoeflea sp.]
MKHVLTRFLQDERGATAVEYGLITALISVALIGGAVSVGNAVNNTMDGAAQHLKNSQ